MKGLMFTFLVVVSSAFQLLAAATAVYALRPLHDRRIWIPVAAGLLAFGTGISLVATLPRSDLSLVIPYTLVVAGSLALVYGLIITSHSLRTSNSGMHSLTGNRDLLQGILNSSASISIIDSDLDNKILFWNTGAELMFGYTAQEMVGSKEMNVLYPPDNITLKIVGEMRETIMRTRAPVRRELVEVTKDGRHLQVSVTISPRFDAGGNVAGFVGIGEDITERKKSERLLRESEERLRRFSEATFEGIIVSESGTVLDGNRQFAEMYGVTLPELIGKDLLALVTRSFRATLHDGFTFTNEEPSEISALRPDGSTFPAEVRERQAILDGRPVKVTAIREITKRKKAEELLRDSEESYRELTNSINDVFFALDRSFHCTHWNKPSEYLTGMSSRDAIGRPFNEVFREARETRLEELCRRAMTTQQIERFENEFTVGNERRVYEVSAYPSRRGLSVFAHDITERMRAEAALRESERRFKQLVDLLPQTVFEIDPGGSVTFVNSQAYSVFGYTREEVRTGLHMSQVIATEDLERARASLLRELREESQGAGEYTMLRKDGSRIPVIIYSTAIVSDDKPVGLRGIIVDITDLKQSELALRESEQRFRTMFENAVTGIAIFDLNQLFLEINPSLEHMFGFLLPELRGMSEPSVTHPDDRGRDAQLFGDLLSGQREHYLCEKRYIRKDGAVVWGNLAMTLVRSANGTPKHAIGMVEDITHRKAAEEALRENEARYRAVVEDQTEFIVRFLPDGIRTFVNDAYCRYHKKTRQELIGTSFLPDLSAGGMRRVTRKIAALTPGRPVIIDEHRTATPDGDVRWYQWTDRAIFDQQGVLAEFQSVGQDISERKLAEEALRESEERYRRITQTVTDYIYTVRMEAGEPAKVTHSEACGAITGYSQADFSKDPDLWLRIVWEEDRAAVEQQMRKTLAGEDAHPIDHRIVRKDGLRRWVRRTPVPHFDANGNLLSFDGLVRDVTETKLTEQALLESEERFRNIYEESPIGIELFDADGTLFDANGACLNIFGVHTVAGIRGLRLFDHLSLPAEALQDLRSGKTVQYEALFDFERLRDGRADWSGKRGTMHIDVQITSMRARDKRIPTGYLVQVQDVTERARAERQIKDSLAEKESLLKEVHHRVKNNLQIVSSLLNLQAEQIHNKKALEALQESQSRVRSMALIHEQLYRSRDLANIDFAQYIRDLTAHLFRIYSVPANNMRLSLHVEDLALHIDKAIPCGMIMNELVSNCLKHAFSKREGGTITLSIVAGEGKMVSLTVADDGIGFPDNLDFQNTPSLGLRLVRILTDQLRGTVSLHRGNGTQFTIRFPVS